VRKGDRDANTEADDVAIDLELLRRVRDEGGFGVAGDAPPDAFEEFELLVRRLEEHQAAGAIQITHRNPNYMNSLSRFADVTCELTDYGRRLLEREG